MTFTNINCISIVIHYSTWSKLIKAWCEVAWLKAGILTFVNERSKTKNMEPEPVRKRFKQLTNEEIHGLVEAKDWENTRKASVGHFAKERCYGMFKFFSDISRPLEAMAWCLELNWHFLERKSSKVWERLERNEGNFCSFFFWQRSTVEFSLVLFLIFGKPKH